MNDRAVALLEQYEIEVLRTRKGRGAILCDTQQDCLIVKLYRSPHANAMVERIDTSVAKKVPGIEAIFTWEDVDQNARR